MPSVQIKGVPDDVHAELRRRSGNAGQSLQEYLRARLIDETRQPPLDELLDRAAGRAGGSVTFRSAVTSLREDRDR